jgi:hypothetical protein
MAHGFSRFGPPTARERFRAAQKTSVWDRLLPTLVATLVMFALVITLARAFDPMINQPIVRLFSVDEVFPAEELKQRLPEPIWERTGPPTPVALTDAEGVPLSPSGTGPVAPVALEKFPMGVPTTVTPGPAVPELPLPAPAVTPLLEVVSPGAVAP